MAEFIQHKGFKLLSMPSLYHPSHIIKTVFPVKGQTLDLLPLKHGKHPAVHFRDFSAQMNFAVDMLLPQITDEGRICQNITAKSKPHTLPDDRCNLRILLWNIVQGIEGQMHRFLIFPNHGRKDFQFRKRAKLYIAAEYFPSVQRQHSAIFPIPVIRYISSKKFVRSGITEPDIFIQGAKPCYDFHTHIQHGNTSLPI